MGVTIECRKTGQSINMGYSSFYNLRKKIAYQVSDMVGKHYACLLPNYLNRTEEYWEEYDKQTQELIDTKKLPVSIAKFLYAPDTDGSIPPSSCKKILELVKDLPDNEKIVPGAIVCATIGDLKKILEECVENKCRMEWH